MNTKILEDIGLTKTETKIYIALLKIGQSTTTVIAKEAQVPASKVYEYIDKLTSKGLVTYTIKANKKHFTASNPSFLKELMKEKQDKIHDQMTEIDALIPSLSRLQTAKKDDINFKVYEGFKGVKSFYENILNILQKGETSHVIGAPRLANELFEGYLLKWHKRRIKKGIHCRYIYDYNVRDFGKIREKMKNTKVKYFPKDINSPMWIEISGDYVGIGHLKGKNTVIFAIQDKEIVKGYLDYFNLLWKTASD